MDISNLMNKRDECDPIKFIYLLKRERESRSLIINSGPPRLVIFKLRTIVTRVCVSFPQRTSTRALSPRVALRITAFVHCVLNVRAD